MVAGLEKDAVAPIDVGPQCQHSAAQGRLIFSAESDVPLGRVGQPLAFEACTGIVKIDIVASIEISDRRCERQTIERPRHQFRLDPLDRRLAGVGGTGNAIVILRSEEHTSELQSLMRISYAVFCLKKKI